MSKYSVYEIQKNIKLIEKHVCCVKKLTSSMSVSAKVDQKNEAQLFYGKTDVEKRRKRDAQSESIKIT